MDSGSRLPKDSIEPASTSTRCGKIATKWAENLVEAIARSRTTRLDRFLYALGIEHVGESTAKTLATWFGSLARIRHLAWPVLTLVPDIGGEVARAIGAGDRDRASTLAAHGLLIGISFGLVFMLGMLIFGPRLLEMLGGRVNVLAQAIGYTQISRGPAPAPRARLRDDGGRGGGGLHGVARLHRRPRVLPAVALMFRHLPALPRCLSRIVVLAVSLAGLAACVAPG